MAFDMRSLRSTKTTTPPKLLVYGVDGIGKTSLAAEFPAPFYLGTVGETPPSDVDLPTPGKVESFTDILDAFAWLLTEPHEFQTVIIDSVDGLEPLVWAATCERLGIKSIEEAGFGKGYVEADTEWQEYLNAVDSLAEAGMYVVQLAHPEIIRFDSPTTDPYSRYTIKLHKRANAMVREQSDIVAFMNYRISLKEKEVGPKKSVTHAEGGKERQIHLSEAAGFVAKNRFNMPDSMVYRKGTGFEQMSKSFPGVIAAAAANDNTTTTKKRGAA